MQQSCWVAYLLHGTLEYQICTSILLSGHLVGFTEEVNFVNCCGPYQDREIFCNQVIGEIILELPNLFLAGDLNFTWSGSKICGQRACLDPLGSFFEDIFNSAGLVGVEAMPLRLTWINGRG